MQPSDKLVMMANQIARNLLVRGEQQAISAAASHIKMFWNKRMRDAVVAEAQEDSSRFHPVALKAIQEVARATG